MSMKRDKTYAYVTAECCKRVDAELPGATVGNRPVSKHGDYSRWQYGKRETLAIIGGNHTFVTGRGYMGECARVVAKLRGWS